MHVLDDKTAEEILISLLAELAKTTNELRCCRQDVDKAQSRLRFCVAAINNLIERTQNEIERSGPSA